ncbi:uncharacterized protein LOC142238572 [Haematobia irritans]|uniref:uncharacterized protein LOC142238572 n=1 Tax=Haematobia irritans TaxID=7368 RepID=UPI003F4FD3E9
MKCVILLNLLVFYASLAIARPSLILWGLNNANDINSDADATQDYKLFSDDEDYFENFKFYFPPENELAKDTDDNYVEKNQLLSNNYYQIGKKVTSQEWDDFSIFNSNDEIAIELLKTKDNSEEDITQGSIDMQEVGDIVTSNHGDLTPKTKTPYINSLALASLAPKNRLLSKEYSDNIQNFNAMFKPLQKSLGVMQHQVDDLCEEFSKSTNIDNDHNGLEHKKIDGILMEILEQVDNLKLKVIEMQNLEKKRNFHLLLNELLEEI